MGVCTTALVVACSSAGTLDTGPEGGVGQACLPDGTCNVGLACLSKRCVAYAFPDSGTIAPADTAAATFAQADCAKTIACYGVPSGYRDADECVARKAAELDDALRAPGTGWTPASMLDCAAKTTTATCAEFWAGLACLQKPGTLAVGSSCARPSQCTTFTCAVAIDRACGVCATGKLGGAACISTDECAFPMMCSSSVCTAPGAEGTACDIATQLCAFGLSCRNGKCAQAGPDASCFSSDQDCQTNNFCSNVTSTCQRDSYGKPGAMCGWVKGDASLWVDCQASPGSCIRGNQQLIGNCPQIAADGQACDGGTTRCLHPAVCEKGKCTALRAMECK